MRSGLCAVLSLVAAIVALAALPATSHARGYELMVSVSADRSGAVPLTAATISGNVYIFVGPETGASQVRFWLDDPRRAGPPETESAAPWDFQDTDLGGGGRPWSSAAVASGPHVIVAEIDLDGGGTHVISSSFTVSQNGTDTVTPGPPALDAQGFELMVSASADRSAAVPLTAATISGSVYIYASPENGASQVRFWLDDPRRGGPPETEYAAPWDFQDTGLGGAGRPWSSAAVASGPHVIVAEIDLDGGGTQVISSSFTVRQDGTDTVTGGAVLPDGGDTGSPPLPPVGTWKLVFADEFGVLLNPTVWHPCYRWATTACPHGNELQLYTPEDAYVQGGSLRMRAQKRDVIRWNGQTYDYSSGMAITGGNSVKPPGFTFTYGFAEARVKVPRGKGLWPAFWMLPAGPAPDSRPEIDVMEILGHETNAHHMNVHFKRADGSNVDTGSTWTSPQDLAAGWHVFAVDWEPDAIVWYVDGVERWRFTDSSLIPNEPMYLLLNLAVGGDWPGAPDASTPFPSYFDVDWVRVWQRL